MNNDLISREALKNTAKIKLGDDITSITILKLFEELIDNAPTVELTRPRGKWKDYSSDGCSFQATCSVCGIRNDIPPIDTANFCPYCGADMRGKEE